MKDLFLLIFFLVSQASPGQVSEKAYTIAKKNIMFYTYKNMQLTMSKPCSSAKNGKLCANLDFLNTVSYKATGRVGTGNGNPGSTVCKVLLKGTVFIGEDEEKNQNSFCLLKDDLYIDNGTLTYYSQKNDGLNFKNRGSN